MARSTRSRSSRAGEPRRASCSSVRAASRATCAPPHRAIPRRSRRVRYRAPRSATWSWSAARARTAPRCALATTTPIRWRPRCCASPTGACGSCAGGRPSSRCSPTRWSSSGAVLDHLAERLQRPHPHHLPGRLGLEHHLLLGERVEAHARLGGLLPLDRDPHQAGDLEDAGAVLREVRLDHVRHGVKDGRDVSAVDADVVGDGAEDVALAPRLRGGSDLQRLAEVELREGSDRPLLPLVRHSTPLLWVTRDRRSIGRGCEESKWKGSRTGARRRGARERWGHPPSATIRPAVGGETKQRQVTKRTERWEGAQNHLTSASRKATHRSWPFPRARPSSQRHCCSPPPPVPLWRGRRCSASATAAPSPVRAARSSRPSRRRLDGPGPETACWRGPASTTRRGPTRPASSSPRRTSTSAASTGTSSSSTAATAPPRTRARRT